MGVENHNAVIATTSDPVLVEKMRYWIADLEELSERFLVGPKIMNGCITIVLVPDGSKEGWHESDESDALRMAFIKRIKEDDYEDGSSPWRWLEIGFGEYGQKVLRGNNENRYTDEEYLGICSR